MLQGGDLISIAITREDKEIIDDGSGYGKRILFDTVVEIGEQRLVIKDTNLSALVNCLEFFYREDLDLLFALGWRSDPQCDEYDDKNYWRYDEKFSGSFKYVKGKYIIFFN